MALVPLPDDLGIGHWDHFYGVAEIFSIETLYFFRCLTEPEPDEFVRGEVPGACDEVHTELRAVPGE